MALRRRPRASARGRNPAGVRGKLSPAQFGVIRRSLNATWYNSNIEAHKVVTIYNGRAEIENRIKEGKNTLRWDKTSCHRFAANQARLLVGSLAYNLLHMIRDAAFWGESVTDSRPRQAHQAACKGWGQGGLPYLAERGVLP